MNRIKPKHITEDNPLYQILHAGAKTMGFLSTDGLIMAHCPDMLKASGQLINSILSGGRIDGGLKRMIGYIVSQSAGCKYCSAHTSFTALRNGISTEKMTAIWEYESSELFSPEERAALRLAHHAGIHPNASNTADFDLLEKFYSAEEIVEIVFTISLYAFLNKFNDTIRTEIEKEPMKVFNQLKKES